MPQTEKHLRTLRTLRTGSLAALALAVLWYTVCVQLAGGSVLALGWYFLLAAALVVLPGLLLVQALLPGFLGAARLCCAFALGLALLFCSALVAGLCGVPYAGFAPPLCAALWQLWRMARAARAAESAQSPRTLLRRAARAVWGKPAAVSPTAISAQDVSRHAALSLLLLCAAGALLVYSCSGVLAFAHAGAAGNMVYHQDMLWSAGNGAAVQFGLPLHDIRTADGLLYYHYLSDALPGLLAMAGGILPYDAACYYNYPLLLFFLLCAGYAAARAYGAGPLPGAALCAAVLFVQGWQSPAVMELLRNVNGVPPATLLACTLLVLVFSALQKNFRLSARYLAAFAAVTGVLLLSKNLYGVLILCAVLAAGVVGSVLRRKIQWNAFALAAVGFAVFGLCWVLLFRFAINNLVQEFWLPLPELLRRLALWLPAGLALWLISLWGSVRGLKTLPLSRLVVNAAAVGGFLAYFLFYHYSASQTYFALAGILFLWFCALDALPYLQKNRLLRGGAIALVLVSLVCTGVSLLPTAQKGAQVALRCAGLRPAYPAVEETISPADEEAALWLRQQMHTDEVFATNRNAKSKELGEGTWHYYTAMSGRQAFVESWRYAMDYGFDYHALRYNLEQVSDGIFAAESAAEAFALARAHDIDYLLAYKPLKPLPFTGAQPVFENDAVRIYRVKS